MFASHGGDLERAAAESGIAPREILDASANIVPGLLRPAIQAALEGVLRDTTSLGRYPEPRYGQIRASAALAFGCDPAQITVANGSAALVDIALRTAKPRRILMPVPAFSEYHKCSRQLGVNTLFEPLSARTKYVADPNVLLEALERSGADGLLLANPNNPTGATMHSADMQYLIAEAARLGVRVLLDEAFIDYAPEAGINLAALPANATVLRSLTKFYGIPGVRIGFSISGDPSFAEHMQCSLPSWPVGAVELSVAHAIFTSNDNGDDVRALNQACRETQVTRLESLGLRCTPSSANFVFVDATARWSGSASHLRSTLLARGGVLVRACDDYAGLPPGCFFRIAVLDDEANARIASVLGDVLRAQG